MELSFNNSNIIHRLKDLEVRVADSKPLTADEKFTEGEILGTFDGPASEAQLVKITASNAKLRGRYVILQMDQGVMGIINWTEVMVFGTPAV